MIRPIVQLGAPVLKTRARCLEPAELGSASIRSLIDDLFETLHHAGGVGLAAPQVGESLRIILAGSSPSAVDPARPLIPTVALINPRIIAASNQTEAAWEGCLSFLQYRVRVSRHHTVTVESLTIDGALARIEAEGFFARVLQHEIDHLDGILTLDRAASPDDICLVEGD